MLYFHSVDKFKGATGCVAIFKEKKYELVMFVVSKF